MSRSSRVTRRDLLKGTVVGGGLAWAAPLLAKETPTARFAPPKNIIFLVADGMSVGVPSLAEPFARLARGRGTRWYELLRRPEATHGFFEMGSLNSLVTDSAAASSAWGSGSRVFNRALNVLPDGTKLTPLAPLVRATGRRVGLVTTASITHATPAGFAAVQANRDDEEAIAPQYLDLVDVALGGGRKFFAPDQRKDKRDMVQEYRGKGYAVCENRDQLLQLAKPSKVLGLFDDKFLPYTLDHQNSKELMGRVPTLAEMTQTALLALDNAPKGFLLQVEGARVDHAAHANDAAAILWDQLAFDDALGVALDYAARRDDTLIIVTSDHGNANPGLNGMGGEYKDSNACFERLVRAKSSYSAIGDKLNASTGYANIGETKTKEQPLVPVDTVVEAIQAATSVTLTKDEAGRVAQAAGGKFEASISSQLAKLVGVLGQALGNHTGIGWTGTQHTADLTLVTAIGPGQAQFSGLLRNTDAFTRLAALMDIRHRNPFLTEEQARRHAVLLPARPDPPHWV